MASVINLSAADNGEYTTVLSAARRVILRSKVVIARGIKVHLALCTIKVTRALDPAASRKRTARVCVWARFMESPSWCWLGAVGACTNGLTAAFKLAPIPTGIQLWAKYICMEMRLATSTQRNNHTHIHLLCTHSPPAILAIALAAAVAHDRNNNLFPPTVCASQLTC